MKNFSLINVINGVDLKESTKVNYKNNVESEVDENVRGGNIKNLIGGAQDFASLSSGLRNAFKDMELAIGLNKNPIMLGKKPLTTADEIFTAIKDGSLTGSKELGRVEKGFLKSRNTDSSLRKTIAIDFASDKNVLDELVKMNRTNTSEIKGYLKSKGYPDESIKEIVTQMKKNGNIDAKNVFVRDSKGAIPKKGKSGKNVPNALFARSKELLNNIKSKKMSWKQLVAWGAAIGIPATALWMFINDNSDTIPEGMPKVKPNPIDDWGPCLNDLISNKEGRVVSTPKGSIVVLVPTTEKYPGGLTFYSNKRVVNNKTKEMGTWTCNGAEATLSEIVNRVLSEQLQIDIQLNKDVNKMIDYLDFPVSKGDLKDAYNLLLTYARNGKGKSFLTKYEQSGHGFNTSLSTTLTFVYTSDPTSIDYKNGMEDLIDKIESGVKVPGETQKVVQPKPTKSRVTINEQSLDIVWDKDKDKKSDTLRPKKERDNKKKVVGKYKDCEGQDFPFAIGCKSSKIADVQRCIGVTDDGKLGPNTRKALIDNKYDTSTGLSKDVYDAVMKNCGNEKKVDSLKSDEVKVDSVKSNDVVKPEQSDLDYYRSLVDNGYIKGDFRETVLNDGTKIPPTNRVKYKGPDLDEKSVSRLDSVLNEMGYSRIKQKLDKSYGDKYVWKKD
jgi:hypothetical protein